MLQKHLNKNNLHHAYLIEGEQEEIMPEILNFCEILSIKTSGNPDFCHITIDNLKIDEAFELRAMSLNKAFSSSKKIFVVCANSFSLDAQNVLLKMFEEPIENTHFFVITPDTNSLLKTLVSRFYLIKIEHTLDNELEAEKFIKMSLQSRINFVKDLLTEDVEEDEDGNEIIALNSIRSKALKFLNALEVIVHKEFLKNCERCGSQPVVREGSSRNNFSETLLEHFFKVRKFLRMPGSSVKSLMESVALVIPEK